MPTRKPTELDRWQRFASYCRSCAFSGERPQTFDEFTAFLARVEAIENGGDDEDGPTLEEGLCLRGPYGQMRVLFFPNGNTVVFDARGEQCSELQQPWFLVMLDMLERYGVDIAKSEFTMPGGRIARPFQISDGKWNWEID